jgi:hypothetical protein
MSLKTNLFGPRPYRVVAVTGIILASMTDCFTQEMPKTQDVCKILRDANKLHGKLVVVRGTLIVASEIGAIYGRSCKAVSIDGTKWGAALAFDLLDPDRPPPEGSDAFTDRKSLDTFAHQLNVSFRMGPRTCNVVVVGVLRSYDERLFYTDSKGKRKRVGFGHLNAFPAELLVVNVRSFSEIRKIDRVPH